jgi:hypothetical protein
VRKLRRRSDMKKLIISLSMLLAAVAGVWIVKRRKASI